MYPSCNNTTNSDWSQEGRERSLVAGGFLIAMAVTICFINGGVIFLFLMKPQLRTAANYFLMSLAISDLSAGLLVIPMGFLKEKLWIDESQAAENHFMAVQATYHVLEKFIAFSTVFHVSAITVERYLAIKRPLKHYLLTETTARRFILAIWIISLGIASIQFSWNLHEPENDEEFLSQYIHERNYYIFCIISIFVLPYILMLFAYFSMFRKIFDTKKTKLKSDALRRHNSSRRKGEHKPLILFLSLTIVFAVCWLPWFTTTLYYLCGGQLQLAVHMTATLIRFLTPLTNPILYTAFKRDFNTALRSVLKDRAILRRTRKEKSETNSTNTSKHDSQLLRSRGSPCTYHPTKVTSSDCKQQL